MTEEVYIDAQCPVCSSFIRLGMEDADPALNCLVCGGTYDLAGHLCPNCLRYHEESASNCSNCGSVLSRICSNCQYTNWSGSEICTNCGQRTDIFVSLTSSAQRSTVSRLSKQMEAAKDLKLEEESSSKKRMAELMAIEEARQEELRQRLERQKIQERQLLTIVIGSVLVFLIILVVIALISTFN